MVWEWCLLFRERYVLARSPVDVSALATLITRSSMHPLKLGLLEMIAVSPGFSKLISVSFYELSTVNGQCAKDTGVERSCCVTKQV